MSAFYGYSRKSFDSLPDICKNRINEILVSLNINALEKSKLFIFVIPFHSDDLNERYKVVKQIVQEFLTELNSNLSGHTRELLNIWQNDFFENASIIDNSKIIKKSELIWPIIVISSQLRSDDDIIDELNESDQMDLERQYNDFIDNTVDRFEFATKVLSDYQSFQPENTTGKEKQRLFVNEKWTNYIEDFGTENENLIKVVINKMLKQKNIINSIKTKVNL